MQAAAHMGAFAACWAALLNVWLLQLGHDTHTHHPLCVRHHTLLQVLVVIGRRLMEDPAAARAQRNSMLQNASMRHRPRSIPPSWALQQVGFPYLKYRAKVAVAMAGSGERFTAFIFTRLPPRRVTV